MMRLYLKVSESKQTIEFNYQNRLTGVIHKWLGENNVEHGKISLYSFSWLQNTIATKEGIKTTRDSYFFVSAYERSFLKKLMSGILIDPEMFCGVSVTEAQITEPPAFSSRERFIVCSPVLIKRKTDSGTDHITFDDSRSAQFLTESLQKKLEVAGRNPDGVSVQFDTSYPGAKTKLITYDKIHNKASLCPVIVEGSPEQVGFAWAVGVGNSTGTGFGSLK